MSFKGVFKGRTRGCIVIGKQMLLEHLHDILSLNGQIKIKEWHNTLHLFHQQGGLIAYQEPNLHRQSVIYIQYVQCGFCINNRPSRAIQDMLYIFQAKGFLH